MEKLQEPINPCLFGEQIDVRCLEEENAALYVTDYDQFLNPEALRFQDFTNDHQQQEESPHDDTLPSLEDKMPFLQMLQAGFGCPPILYQDPSFLLLPRLQQGQEEEEYWKKHLPWETNHHLFYQSDKNTITATPTATKSTNSFLVSANELESCVTNEIMAELYSSSSPTKSETRELVISDEKPPNSDENLSSGCNQLEEKRANSTSRDRTKQTTQMANPPLMANKERKKRKRTRPTKNKEEIESQRMTHIAVERNRRRQMNDHLNCLRPLMPSSYVQRGDQASIVGGAIDFVKELEQLMRSLQAQKRMKQLSEESNGDVSVSASSPSTTSSSCNLLSNLFMASTTSQLQPTSSHDNNNNNNDNDNDNDINDNDGQCLAKMEAAGGGRRGEGREEFTAVNTSTVADVAVVVIHNHVNLKVQCQRKSGQLVKAILALEDARLSVLHLNITSLQSWVHYSFNLKVEDDCKLRSADEIAAAVRQIFNLITTLTSPPN